MSEGKPDFIFGDFDVWVNGMDVRVVDTYMLVQVDIDLSDHQSEIFQLASYGGYGSDFLLAEEEIRTTKDLNLRSSLKESQLAMAGVGFFESSEGIKRRKPLKVS